MNPRYLLPLTKYVSEKIFAEKDAESITKTDAVKMGLSLLVDLVVWFIILLFVLFIVVPVLFIIMLIVLVLVFIFIVLFIISLVIRTILIIPSLPWLIVCCPCILATCCLRCCVLVLEDPKHI